jgi:hypothetical protein
MVAIDDAMTPFLLYMMVKGVGSGRCWEARLVQDGGWQR